MAAAPTTEVVANVAVAVSSSSAAAAAADEAASTVAPSVIRSARLPLTRVKALVKADPDVSLASQEAIFVLARAAELFVETIAKDAYVYAQQGKRKTLQRKDLDNAIEAIDEFAFLEGNLQIKAYHGGVFKSSILLLQSKVVLWIELNKKESLEGKRELSKASIARGVK